MHIWNSIVFLKLHLTIPPPPPPPPPPKTTTTTRKTYTILMLFLLWIPKVAFWSLKPRILGTSEHWSLGALEPRSLGALEPRSLGASEPRSPGASEPWSFGALEFRSLGASEPRSLGASEPWSFGAWEPRLRHLCPQSSVLEQICQIVFIWDIREVYSKLCIKNVDLSLKLRSFHPWWGVDSPTLEWEKEVFPQKGTGNSHPNKGQEIL